MGKPKKSNNAVNTAKVVLPNDLSQDELRQIIVNVLLEVENIKFEREQEQKRQEKIAWRKAIGFHDYSSDKCHRIRKWLKQEWNNVVISLKIIFLPKKEIKGNFATISLLKTILSMFFGLIKWGLYFFSAYFIYLIVGQYILNNIEASPLYVNVIMLAEALFAFVIGRLLRIVCIEIEKIEDNNYFLGIFASITSIISIGIAAIAIVRGG